MLVRRAAQLLRRATLILSLGSLGLLVPSAPDAWVASANAGENEIHIGDQLQAIDDVTLDEAQIRKGSRVSVSGRTVRSGLVFLDVALADGHVVRALPITSVRRTFRIVRG